MNDALVDRISGGLGMLLAGGYILSAQGIEDSLLADGVGAYVCTFDCMIF